MRFLNTLHAKLGDFWWYSLMLFLALRAADCLNVFVGLWLVPKYVNPSELGAVLPLTQFASFLALLPHGTEYSAYWWATPWIVGITSLNLFCTFFATSEVSAFRFGYMKWMVPLTLLYPVALLLVTGHGYFTAHLPDFCTNFLVTHNITTLSAMLWWMTGIAALKALGCALAMLRQKPVSGQPHHAA